MVGDCQQKQMWMICIVYYEGGDVYADGGKLKSTSNNYWTAQNTGAENLFGFDVRGGGIFGSGGFFQNIYIQIFWTSSVK